MKKLYPPLGYMWADGEGISAEDEQKLREEALSLSDDPKFNERIQGMTAEELLEFFIDNGFEILDE